MCAIKSVLTKMPSRPTPIISRISHFAWGRDDSKITGSDIEIEERDPAEIRQVLGQPTTIDEIGARYPTFDIYAAKICCGRGHVYTGCLAPTH